MIFNHNADIRNHQNVSFITSFLQPISITQINSIPFCSIYLINYLTVNIQALFMVHIIIGVCTRQIFSKLKKKSNTNCKRDFCNSKTEVLKRLIPFDLYTHI